MNMKRYSHALKWLEKVKDSLKNDYDEEIYASDEHSVSGGLIEHRRNRRLLNSVIKIWKSLGKYSDYEELQRLKDSIDWEQRKNRALEKQIDELKQDVKRKEKAFELMCDSNDKLRQLLGECKEKIEPIMGDIPSFKNLLTRINEVL